MSNINYNIIIMDWAGRTLVEGHYKDDIKEIDACLKANRCDCYDKSDTIRENCISCDNSGYSGDIEIYWVKPEDHEDREDNIYDYINY